MPTNLLNVPHYEQERASSCLPACVRMVLAFWQHFTSESKLANLLGTQSLFKDTPQAIPMDDFLLAWSEFDYRYALIQPE